MSRKKVLSGFSRSCLRQSFPISYFRLCKECHPLVSKAGYEQHNLPRAAEPELLVQLGGIHKDTPFFDHEMAAFQPGQRFLDILYTKRKLVKQPVGLEKGVDQFAICAKVGNLGIDLP